MNNLTANNGYFRSAIEQVSQNLASIGSDLQNVTMKYLASDFHGLVPTSRKISSLNLDDLLDESKHLFDDLDLQ